MRINRLEWYGGDLQIVDDSGHLLVYQPAFITEVVERGTLPRIDTINVTFYLPNNPSHEELDEFGLEPPAEKPPLTDS